MMRATSIWIVALACAGAAACGSTQKPGRQLMDDVRTYQEGLRWRRYEDSASRLPAKVREMFLDVHEELDDELRVDDYEIMRVKFDGEKLAMVQVKITWHLDSVGIVHDTVVEQKWRLHKRSWYLVGEQQRRGEEIPGLAGTVLPAKEEVVD
jgi:hypothetical protein